MVEVLGLPEGGVDVRGLGTVQILWVSEDLVGVLPCLADDGARVERLPEDRLRISPQLCRSVLAGAERRRRADADEMALRCAEPILEATQKESEVGALRPVKGMHLVDHEEAQGLGVVLLPQRLVPTA